MRLLWRDPRGLLPGLRRGRGHPTRRLRVQRCGVHGVREGVVSGDEGIDGHGGDRLGVDGLGLGVLL
jgi:hypothetical protein